MSDAKVLRAADATDATAAYGKQTGPQTILKPGGGKIRFGQIVTGAVDTEYETRDVFPDSNSTEPITLCKSEAAISDPAFLASLEGCPLILTHGLKFIDRWNWKDRAVGHGQNFRLDRDKNGTLVVRGDLHFQDGHGVDRTDNDLRSLSVGYEYQLEEVDGKLYQTNLRANHIAAVFSPRVPVAVMTDSQEDEMDAAVMSRLEDLCKVLERLLSMLGGKSDSGETSTDARDPDAIPVITHQPGKGAAARSFPDLTAVAALLKGEQPTNPVGDDSSDISSIVANLQGGATGEMRDALRTYDALRSIRDSIAGTGELSLVRGYNEAMVTIKHQIGTLVMEAPRGKSIAFDTRTDKGSNGEFESACRDARARLLGEATPGDPNSYFRRVQLTGKDGAKPDSESYEDQVKRVRERMLAARP